MGALFLSPGPVDSRPLSNLSARMLYQQALQRIWHTRGFDLQEVTHYRGYPANLYHNRVTFVAPERIRVATELGGIEGTQVAEQVGSTDCYWSIGKPFRRIFCSHLAWHASSFRQDVEFFLAPSGLPQESFAVSSTHVGSGRHRHRIRVITVRAHANPLMCPPGAQCPAEGIDTRERYTGVMEIGAKSGLPLAYHSTVTFLGHAVPGQQASFTYTNIPAVNLPRNKRVPCPSWAAPGAWCLQQAT